MNMAGTMRAVVVRAFGPPDVLKVEQVAVPKCTEKQVLVRVHAAGVNPVDTYLRSGVYSVLPQSPYTPGKDAAGVVEAVGVGVSKFKAGDRVFCSRKVIGTYAELAICPEDSCWPLANRLTFGQGASVGVPYFTAYRALFQKANAKPSNTVLVHGASGGVGLAAVQLAKARGIKVYGTAGTEEGMKLVKDNGAVDVYNHKEQGYVEKMMNATNGKGFDVIIEMLANVNLGKDLELLEQDGILVVVGSRGTVEINPRLLMTKNSTVTGVSLMVSTEDHQWDEMAAAIMAGCENGTITPVVHKQYPLEKAADAHRDIIESSGAKGNLVLTTEQDL